MKDFDYILDQIGPFGRYQYLHWFTLSLAILPTGIQNLLNVYLSVTPEHWCHVPELTNLSIADQRLLTSPPGELYNGHDTSCEIRDIDYSKAYESFLRNETSFQNQSTATRTCSQWQYDYELYGITAVSKWDLVCSRAAQPAIAQSVYMLGFLIGAIVFGYTSDRYGRKSSLYAGIVGMISFSLLSCFMPEFWSHITIRFITGVATCGCLTISFVMIMEVIGSSKRLLPGLFAQIFFASGYMLLALIANFTRDFFLTNLVSALVPVLLLCYWWTEPESARWLLAHGRVEEARHILKKMASMNRSNADVDILLKEHIQHQQQLGDKHSSPATQYTIIDLLRTPNMRKKSINIMFNWFVTSMVYYGLSMGVTDLGGSPYVNLFISGVMECSAVCTCCVILDRFGRRLCLSLVLIICGIACFLIGLLPEEYSILRIILSMIGKFGVSGSFAIIYLFSAELFPTVVRTIGVGAGSMSARFGGLLAPFVAEMSIIWLPLPTLIFGTFAVTAGLLSLLLPETLGKTLPDSMEEGEEFGKDVKFLACYWPRRAEPKEKCESEENSTVNSVTCI